MRTAVTTLLALTVSIPGAARAASTSSADEAAIRRVIQQQDVARKAGDWKALGQLFTEDADQFTSAGEWRRGRAAIEKGVAQTMGSTYKGGTYVTKVERVRMVAPGVALADTAFEIANIKGGSRRGHAIYVLVKSGDAWRIAASRSMVPTPVGATPPR